MKKTMSQIRPLTESAPLTEVTVVQLKLDAAEQEKLSQLGLHRGGTVRVLQRAINEPLLKYRISTTGKSGHKWKSAKMTYRTYRYMGFGFFRSLLYFICYAFHGVRKYFFWFLR